ncbi:tetratricopeptide repeat protein [Halorhodospira halophila]|uniref:Tetratricopeptide TPR_2 repeat protein n=1 Tax=Halorhodospira halophila (strain DSM 244 / SL1) TaxID=349124 RepID=A1WUF7_HALHL|nr:tetratricopeptide repeat protein [Halorhodospira halophila]ABM61319.1 Tetratricopeptide TPR_2 repeat protein [Halorhodospira halophila SL1]MBK1729098.1 hypothetical protein [Halorhodospira halophila]
MTRWRMFSALPALVLLAPVACYVPPDDGIARSDHDTAEQADASRGDAPERETEQEQEDQGGWWSQPQPAPRQEEDQTRGDDVATLAQRAREAYEGRDYDGAVRHLEQALDQAPEQGVLWQNLAAVRYQQGHYQRAEELALRAVDTGDQDLAVMREAWWLVAAARMERGDRGGARDAASTARRFGEAGDGGLGGF